MSDTRDRDDFEAQFLRSLLRRLDQAGLGVLAYAILRSSSGSQGASSDREELDSLIDLAIHLLSRRQAGMVPLRPPERPKGLLASVSVLHARTHGEPS
jgi:type II secretory pathway component PulJ